MFSFKVFLLFRVRVVGGRIAEKESILARKKVVTIVSFGFSQMWKISNVKAAESAVTSVLKKLSQLSGKAVIAIMRQLS